MSLNDFPRGRTAIVAGATYGIGEAPGYDSLDLAALASLKALDMAGLQPKDVDGLFIVLPSDPFSHLSMAQYFGIHPKVMDNNRTGGSSFQIHAHYAALALAAGECDVALIAYGSNLRTSAGKFASTLRPSIYQAPYKPMIPVSAYALAAARHTSVWHHPRAASRGCRRGQGLGQPQSGCVRQGPAPRRGLSRVPNDFGPADKA